MPRLVGIFGGTFDPVHIGHTRTIAYLLDIIPFEKILIIPNALPVHKENSQESFQHRFKMVSIAFQCIDKTFVDYREKLRNGPSYAIDTVKEVLEEETDAKVIFIVGSDSFSEIDSWHKWEGLLSLVDFIVMKRPNHPLTRSKKAFDLINKTINIKDLVKKRKIKNIVELKVTPVTVSSSLVRQHVLEGRGVEHLVSKKVGEYLKKHNLYDSKNLP